VGPLGAFVRAIMRVEWQSLEPRGMRRPPPHQDWKISGGNGICQRPSSGSRRTSFFHVMRLAAKLRLIDQEESGNAGVRLDASGAASAPLSPNLRVGR